MSAYPCMAACGSLPPIGWFEQANHIFPRNQGSPSLLLLQGLSPTASGCVLCSRLQFPCGPAGHSVLFSWAGVHVTKKLWSVTSVQCWVFCVSLIDGVKSSPPKQKYIRHGVKIQFLSMSTYCGALRRERHVGLGRYKRRPHYTVAEYQTQNEGNFMTLPIFPPNLIFLYSEMAQQ